MGLLDNLGGLGGALGGLTGMNTAGNPQAALLQGLLGLLSQGGGSGMSQTGGAGPLGGLGSVLGGAMGGSTGGGLGGGGMGGGGLGGMVAGLGGLGGLLQRFQNVGLGNVASSWVGTGPNQPISGDQVRSALGPDTLRTLADHAGMDENQAASNLSGLLPEVVDRLTPNGQVPDNGLHPGGMAGALSELGHLFGRSA